MSLGWSQALKLVSAQLLISAKNSFSVRQQNHLIQGLARCNHGKANVRDNFEVYQHRAIKVQPLLYDLWQFFLGFASYGFNSIGLCKGHKVRVDVVNTDKAAVEKKPLPNPHHLLPVIVHDGHLDWQVIPLHRLEVHVGHTKGSIPIDQDGECIRVGHLSSDGKGKARSHDTKTSAGDETSRPDPSQELARHHLMVAHSGGNVGIFHQLLLVQELVHLC
mmetsp:Transcript_20367/g.36417  ORF Transcript_20367/g.36417 Transcript_20367/m.36417 type:complete len:219 (-) Transcript_20367:1400-2056(-)